MIDTTTKIDDDDTGSLDDSEGLFDDDAVDEHTRLRQPQSQYYLSRLLLVRESKYFERLILSDAWLDSPRDAESCAPRSSSFSSPTPSSSASPSAPPLDELRVTIDPLEARCFHALLYYIYTSDVLVSSFADLCQLLLLADRFCVQSALVGVARKLAALPLTPGECSSLLQLPDSLYAADGVVVLQRRCRERLTAGFQVSVAIDCLHCFVS
jgi:hypothetical protein